MTAPFNPFEHHHDHGDEGRDQPHDHGLPVAELDPAQQSLADALRVTFFILKAAMLVLVVAYLFSGFFSVPANQAAVRLCLGRIVGDTVEQQVLPPGGPHLALPYPVEEVVFIPTNEQTLGLKYEFWYEPQPGHEAGKSGPLNPEKDGSLITGDANVVHGQWQVVYRLRTRPGTEQIEAQAAIDYVKHVGGAPAGQKLVRLAAEQGIVHAMAGFPADLVPRKDFSVANARAKQRAQEVLNSLNSGLVITSITCDQASFPPSVRDAVDAVANAENVRATQLESARRDAAATLTATAGEAARPLLALIEEYEQASSAGDKKRLEELEARFDQAFSDFKAPTPQGPVEIGGEVRQILDEARSYRTRIVTELRAEADTFRALREQYRQNPAIFTNRLWQDAMETILASKSIQVFYAPTGQVYLEINRDPAIRKTREEERLKELKDKTR